jgi:hypothetical protein
MKRIRGDEYWVLGVDVWSQMNDDMRGEVISHCDAPLSFLLVSKGWTELTHRFSTRFTQRKFSVWIKEITAHRRKEISDAHLKIACDVVHRLSFCYLLRTTQPLSSFAFAFQLCSPTLVPSLELYFSLVRFHLTRDWLSTQPKSEFYDASAGYCHLLMRIDEHFLLYGYDEWSQFLRAVTNTPQWGERTVAVNCTTPAHSLRYADGSRVAVLRLGEIKSLINLPCMIATEPTPLMMMNGSEKIFFVSFSGTTAFLCEYLNLIYEATSEQARSLSFLKQTLFSPLQRQ